MSTNFKYQFAMRAETSDTRYLDAQMSENRLRDFGLSVADLQPRQSVWQRIFAH